MITPAMAKRFWDNVLRPKPYCITTWNAVLRIERFPKHKSSYNKSKLFLVSDPDCIDAGQYIRGDEIKAIIRLKTYFK